MRIHTHYARNTIFFGLLFPRQCPRFFRTHHRLDVRGLQSIIHAHPSYSILFSQGFLFVFFTIPFLFLFTSFWFSLLDTRFFYFLSHPFHVVFLYQIRIARLAEWIHFIYSSQESSTTYIHTNTLHHTTHTTPLFPLPISPFPRPNTLNQTQILNHS